ncbi:MAG: hypothetical protein RIR48_3445 [Bacteroidota bacterium]
MKQFSILSMIYISMLLSSCVQKTYERPVRFFLNVSQVDNIKTVGVRGSNSPLNWEKDLVMKPIFADSIYAVDVTFLTGYLGAEIKFVINGQFELQKMDNRRFAFDKNQDTTVYHAVFDQPK